MSNPETALKTEIKTINEMLEKVYTSYAKGFMSEGEFHQSFRKILWNSFYRTLENNGLKFNITPMNYSRFRTDRVLVRSGNDQESSDKTHG